MRGSILSICALVSATYASHVLLPRTPSTPLYGNASATNLFSCAAASWPQSDVGVPLTPQPVDSELAGLLSEIDPARIEAYIAKLVSFGTRHTLSAQNSTTRGIGAARDWIAQEMRSFAATSEGRMTVSVPGYIQGLEARVPFPVLISNVVARIEGSTDPSRVYVISGHYDSRASDPNDYTSDAPGANDDASGVAVVLEIARILATRQPKATILLGAVAGEEQGLYGSNFWAQTLRNASVNVEGVLNNDIVGSSTGDRGQRDPYTIRVFAQGLPPTESAARRAQRLTIGGENDSPARQLARFSVEVAANNATGMNIAIIYRLDRYLRGGDHRSFLEAGYSAVRYTEPNEDYAHQHQDVRVENGTQYGDLIEFVDFEYVARVAKVNLATLWSIANAPGQVRNATVNATLLSNDSQFSWLRSNDTDIEGYEVVWRPTAAPLWTHVVDVGLVSTVTLPLSKDNVIFGIRSRGRNGYRSPAVLPFPG
ncbi:hypothetical protein W97_08474 [Coniosporium apollinis CBS 100218]|uniref:Peptide hydrolase n=1 Tax=Coniosporium apollinis (strain CBS 100218) TaxID=1168221 RepID=R7Z4V2_CONA1|nr:uncharacterized protein W97_08474 [Coniosporium apollinis CBS 100218]EON69215.1 hypothetical protein W97_08474 [Coniosporium apollinis CBS 100218]